MSINNSVQIIISYKKIAKELKSKYRYNDQQVLHTVWRLFNSCEEVKRAFSDWYLNDKDPHIQCEGISWKDLVVKKELNPYNAFLFMDSLIKNPARCINVIDVQMLPHGTADLPRTRSISVDDLRPDLREYVAQKLKEEEAEDLTKKEELLKDGDKIDFNRPIETPVETLNESPIDSI